MLIEEGSSEVVTERVANGELHAAVAFQDAALPRREHEGVERRDLRRETFLVALAPDHALARARRSRWRPWPSNPGRRRAPAA